MHHLVTFKSFAQFWTTFEEKLWTKIASANLTCDTQLLQTLFGTEISTPGFRQILSTATSVKCIKNRFRGTSVRRLWIIIYDSVLSLDLLDTKVS